MAISNYMKRIAFADGMILHDYHLNQMQANIAETIKVNNTQERYDMLLLVSTYNYYFAESFINEDNKDPMSTAVLDKLAFSITGGTWVTPVMELPEETSEIYINANMLEYPSQGSVVKFAYRTAVGELWKDMKPDTAITLATPTKYVQVKVECVYSTYTKPVVYDFALMWK